MKRIWLYLIGCVAVVGTAVAEVDERVVAARSILDGFHEGAPAEERFLHLVYWTPADVEPAEGWENRVPKLMEDIQAFYADEMERHGFGKRSIRFQRDGADKMVIHLVKGQMNKSEYGKGDGNRIAAESDPVLREAGIDAGRETVFYFCNLADWKDDHFTHHSPYYGGGNWRSGRCWASDDIRQDIRNIVVKQKQIHDGEYGWMSLGRHVGIFIGGIAHELGHALGLPHNTARQDEEARGTALMGSGNHTYRRERRHPNQKGSFLTLAHAMRLASHPMFSGSTKAMGFDGRAVLSEESVAVAGKGFVFSGKLEGRPPVYGLVGYMDPEGGGDYNAPTVVGVPDADGRFSLVCDDLRAGKAGEFRLTALHANGATSVFRYGYGVGEDGVPDVSAMQEQFLLKPLVDTLRGGGDESARVFVGALENERGKDDPITVLARDVLESRAKGGKTDLAAVGEDVKVVRLGDLKPGTAEVGWNRPVYNRVERGIEVVQSGGTIFANSVYAHAPSRFGYPLGESWNRLAGEAGLQDGKRGSVVFVVKGDGKELWRSGRVTAGQRVTVDVAVDGVAELELVVENAGDGNGADWGMWLGCELRR